LVKAVEEIVVRRPVARDDAVEYVVGDVVIIIKIKLTPDVIGFGGDVADEVDGGDVGEPLFFDELRDGDFCARAYASRGGREMLGRDGPGGRPPGRRQH